MTLMVSCGEAKKETKEVTEEEVSTEAEESKELHADHEAYQCPMDCEDGKTYKNYDTGTNRFFEAGFGKLVILR